MTKYFDDDHEVDRGPITLMVQDDDDNIGAWFGDNYDYIEVHNRDNELVYSGPSEECTFFRSEEREANYYFPDKDNDD